MLENLTGVWVSAKGEQTPLFQAPTAILLPSKQQLATTDAPSPLPYCLASLLVLHPRAIKATALPHRASEGCRMPTRLCKAESLKAESVSRAAQGHQCSPSPGCGLRFLRCNCLARTRNVRHRLLCASVENICVLFTNSGVKTQRGDSWSGRDVAGKESFLSARQMGKVTFPMRGAGCELCSSL